MAIRFAASALRHGIVAERALHVIENCPDPIYPAPSLRGETDRVLFLGPDQNGVPLEILAVEVHRGELLVIHVMKLRRKYSDDYMRGDVMARTVITKSGHVLTDVDIERLADEAERGYDLSTWVHKRGRPPLEAGLDEPSPRIAVRVPPSLHRRVTSQAAAEGRSVSEVVRDLLEGYVQPRSAVSAGRRST